jgi:hypothetical protein
MSMFERFSWLLLGMGVVVAGVAAPSGVARADGGAREHDGLYLRIGLGPGYTIGSSSVGDASESGGGVAINSELALGGTVAPGLVVGGGTFPMVVPAPSYGGVDAGGHHLSATGVFADYYFDPARGLHAQAALLFVAGYRESAGAVGSGVGFGFGAMLGIGYEFWLGNQWSLGPLLRFTYYHWSAETDDGTSLGMDLVTPALLLAVTYH